MGPTAGLQQVSRGLRRGNLNSGSVSYLLLTEPPAPLECSFSTPGAQFDLRSTSGGLMQAVQRNVPSDGRATGISGLL